MFRSSSSMTNATIGNKLIINIMNLLFSMNKLLNLKKITILSNKGMNYSIYVTKIGNIKDWT